MCSCLLIVFLFSVTISSPLLRYLKNLKKLKKHSRTLTRADTIATVIGGGAGGGPGGGGKRGAKGGGGWGGGGGDAASAGAESTAESMGERTVGSEAVGSEAVVGGKAGSKGVAQAKIRVVFLSKCFTEDHSHGKLVAGVMRYVFFNGFKVESWYSYCGA